METLSQASRACAGTSGGPPAARCIAAVLVAGALAACGGGSVSEDFDRPVPQQASPAQSTAAPSDGSNKPTQATLQVRLECGLSFSAPCGTAGVVRITQGHPPVPFEPWSGGEVYHLAYDKNQLVMSAPVPYPRPSGLPYGLDVYRGDVPIVGRQSPRCRFGDESDPPCKRDTALAFLAFYDFPTHPASPRIMPILPPEQWEERGNGLAAAAP
jgi:hypothetical protein